MKQDDIINEPPSTLSLQEIPYQRLTIEKAKSTIDWLLWDFGMTTNAEEQADKIISIKELKDGINLIIYDEEKGMNKYKDNRLISYKQLVQNGRDILNKNSIKFSSFLADTQSFIFFTISSFDMSSLLSKWPHLFLSI